LDDKLVIFKDTATFFQVGDGPLSTGQQSDYQDPQLISSDVGCQNPRSVVVTPLGIMFQSQKGIWLLNRELGMQYIGAPVEQYNGLTVSSAQVIDTNNEVRFTTYTGELLVYNYFFNEWYVFTNYAAQDATNYLGTYCHLTANGLVHQETTNYNDNNQIIQMVIETAWLKTRNIQGFQRIFHWILLGDQISPCITQIQVAYNYESVYNEQMYFNSLTGLGSSTYGDSITYGSDTVFGGTNSTVYQVRSKPRQAKSEAIKFRITELDTLTPNGGGSFSLVGLDLEVGVRTGTFRLGNNKTIGS